MLVLRRSTVFLFHRCHRFVKDVRFVRDHRCGSCSFCLPRAAGDQRDDSGGHRWGAASEQVLIIHYYSLLAVWQSLFRSCVMPCWASPVSALCCRFYSGDKFCGCISRTKTQTQYQRVHCHITTSGWTFKLCDTDEVVQRQRIQKHWLLLCASWHSSLCGVFMKCFDHFFSLFCVLWDNICWSYEMNLALNCTFEWLFDRVHVSVPEEHHSDSYSQH